MPSSSLLLLHFFFFTSSSSLLLLHFFFIFFSFFSFSSLLLFFAYNFSSASVSSSSPSFFLFFLAPSFPFFFPLQLLLTLLLFNIFSIHSTLSMLIISNQHFHSLPLFSTPFLFSRLSFSYPYFLPLDLWTCKNLFRFDFVLSVQYEPTCKQSPCLVSALAKKKVYSITGNRPGSLVETLVLLL